MYYAYLLNVYAKEVFAKKNMTKIRGKINKKFFYFRPSLIFMHTYNRSRMID